MSVYCPLGANEYGTMPHCSGQNCGLADDNGECLIKQALQYYVNDKKEAAETRAALEKDPLLNALFNRNSFSKVKTSEPTVGEGY